MAKTYRMKPNLCLKKLIKLIKEGIKRNDSAHNRLFLPTTAKNGAADIWKKSAEIGISDYIPTTTVDKPTIKTKDDLSTQKAYLSSKTQKNFKKD